jgi:hypothetical protein
MCNIDGSFRKLRYVDADFLVLVILEVWGLRYFFPSPINNTLEVVFSLLFLTFYLSLWSVKCMLTTESALYSMTIFCSSRLVGLSVKAHDMSPKSECSSTWLYRFEGFLPLMLTLFWKSSLISCSGKSGPAPEILLLINLKSDID